MTQKTILVVGATGLLGRAALRHFRDLSDWQVIGLSRRAPDIEGIKHVPADLKDRDSLAAHHAMFADVTHVLYAALYELDDLIAGWRDPGQMDVNLVMFQNLMDVITDASAGLVHVHLLQGTKAYGIHVEPMRAPAKERWPRHRHENFYWLQEDDLKARQVDRNWVHTIWRPQVVLGQALGSPMNLIAALGVYASICREAGIPCRYPGGAPIVTEATDARLLARAVVWAADNPAAVNQTFNITNGDTLLWPHLWPTICDHFRVSMGEPEPQTLAETMPEKEAIWDELVRAHDLRRYTMARLVGNSWQFLDRAMRAGNGPAPPSLVSTIKLRQVGFHDCFDTEDTLRYWFTVMQNDRLLPRWPND